MSNAGSSERLMKLSTHAVLLWVLRGLSDQGVAQVLYEQSLVAAVAGGPLTMLELAVPMSCKPVDIPDGPLDVRTVAIDERDEPVGEVLVWVLNGYLSTIEYAWHTDLAPTEFPPPSRLRHE